jgi:hypothetical protein
MGVTERTIDRWRQDATFPEAEGGLFSVPKVAEWQTLFGKKGDDVSVEAAKIQLRLKREMLAMKRLERRRMEREEKIAEGLYIDRRAVENWASEVTVATRDQFHRSPRLLAMLVPRECQVAFVTEAEKVTARILDDLHDALMRGDYREGDDDDD